MKKALEGKGEREIREEEAEKERKPQGEGNFRDKDLASDPVHGITMPDIPRPQLFQLGLLQRKKLQRAEGSLGGPRGLAHM